MRRLRFRLPRPVAAGLLALVTFSAASAAPESSETAGAPLPPLSAWEEDLLLRFRQVFAPLELPEELRSADVPAKSATRLLLEYRRNETRITPALRTTLDDFLAIDSQGTETLRSEHFRFRYETTGEHAVPLEDVAPANGVPDFVERVAVWAETSWRVLFDELGFAEPPLIGGEYEVSFREMETFGYTTEKTEGTAIVLHRDFEDFPANSDPDGPAAGAAKVTIAHELKHASQHVSSGWTEGGWLEADATWAEDAVFDETNDYHRLLWSGSPITDPENWLAEGDASYEDCLWQHLLTEQLGPGVLVDFFERRAAHPAETVISSFAAVLDANSSSLSEMAEKLALWSFFCGANSINKPYGFEEAAAYPTPATSEQILEYPAQFTAQLGGLASHYIFAAASDRSGPPTMTFFAAEDREYRVSAIALDRLGRRFVYSVPTRVASITTFEVPLDWRQISLLMIVVTNVADGAEAPYHITLDDDLAVSATGLADEARLSLEPNRPNPFRTDTSISFTLPRSTDVRLTIFDVSGRLVRRLASGKTLDAGAHTVVWDGRDEAGRSAAPGVYAYRLETERGAQARKMLRLR